MISFGTQVAAANAIIDALGVREDDRMLSYLPLAHAFERWVVEATGMLALANAVCRLSVLVDR